MSRGLFFTFEGIDGCGKSTQARLLNEYLVANGYRTVATREPGGTPIAEKIRELLIDPANGAMVDECELLLYLAARAQHVREKIIPALTAGQMVICDRFQDATFAYQGFGRGLSMDFLRTINTFAAGIEPDCTFIFDISVDRAFERMHAMNKSKDRLESSGRAFFDKIREGYLSLSKQHPERILLLDGTLPIESLAEIVQKNVLQRAKHQE